MAQLKKRLSMLLRLINGACLDESGQWLEKVDRTHLVLASGKPVLQKLLFYPLKDYAGNFCWINQPSGLALFFALPVVALLLENLVMWVIVIICLVHHHLIQRSGNDVIKVRMTS